MAKDRRRDDSPPGDPAEGVRIIGAEEAAEAIERGDVASRRGAHLPRYGDRPARPPVGPKPALRFPLEADADPEIPSLRPAKGTRFDPRPAPAWDEPEAAEEGNDPWPESTWTEAAGEWAEEGHDDVVAWTRGETGTMPAVEATDPPASGGDDADGLSWADDFVGEEEAWDGSWDEPTGAVAWADDAAPAAGPASAPDDAVVEAAAGLTADPTVDPVTGEPPGAGAVVDVTDSTAPDADDEWAAFGTADDAADTPKRGRRFFRRDRGEADDSGSTPEVTDDGAADDAVEVAPVAAPAGEVDVTEVDVAEGDDEVWAPAAVEPHDGDEAGGLVEDEAPVAEGGPGDEPGTDSPWGEPSWGADAVVADAGSDDAPAPLFDADGGWAAQSDQHKVFDFADEPSGQVALPHWTEPGTGELPRIFAADEEGAVTESEPSGTVPAVHWRGPDSDWDDEGFDDLTEIGEGLRVGALDDERPHEEELYDFDELDELAPDEHEPAIEPDHVVVGSGRRVAPARPVPEPASTGGSGRNMGVAAAVGLGVAALAIALLYLGPQFAMILVVAAVVVAVGEFQAATHRAGYRPATFFGLVVTALYPIAVYWKGIEAYPLLAVLTVGAGLAWHLVGADGDARVVESVGVTLFGIAWIGGFGSFGALLLAQEDGRGMFVTAVIAAVAYDVGGLLIGRTMGSRHFSDASPNKTVEGLVGGIILSMATVFIVVGLFGLAPWDSPGDAMKIAMFAALAAPLGDLCESLVKRDLGIKDMGNLLPEHGGLLDRFDGLLFVLPAVFYAAMFWQIAPF